MPLSLQAIHVFSDTPGPTTLIVPGGRPRAAEGALTGPLTLASLAALRFDTAILGCCGLSAAEGLTAPGRTSAGPGPGRGGGIPSAPPPASASHGPAAATAPPRDTRYAPRPQPARESVRAAPPASPGSTRQRYTRRPSTAPPAARPRTRRSPRSPDPASPSACPAAGSQPARPPDTTCAPRPSATSAPEPQEDRSPPKFSRSPGLIATR
jgi:hypothetical protein